ncbi:putative RNA polymerase ECF-subfamily sigma factor [Actinoplanes missouriensis 431]|uniref:Putative RNA polymerase ECF-subfamily sigma factor n=1 Tax=Actinoplanes missouriensis (strain ATCC 14538 / DSM 43046 / CBS 188.64 / JCM 3121 / NBRC 102363 / NCIMB 12654 / NRRL B-3342 / UNCC 431) TaxID=512565 RepID=I0H9R0_ACTM4|nr:RNA polymerase sigma factor [Actinoplanes missouriensis]BAL89747.1 putative RNA polymerase ECF-subfamily sigma factor [Actinoplanes missouriensis 431]
MPKDDELADALTAARAGDEQGFAVLWRALNPAVLRYLRLIAGDAAEDVASETWLQAARDLDRFTGDPAAFRAWLFRIARHRGIDEQRRAGRRREHLASGGGFSGGALDGGGVFDGRVLEGGVLPGGVGGVLAGGSLPAAEAEVIEGAETAWALSRVAELPADQAEAVMLRIVAGLDVADTARILGKRRGAVRIATMRGLRRLAADPQVRLRAAEQPRSPRPETTEKV